MSVPAGTEEVTGAPVNDATNNAVDDAEKHTKEAVETPPPPPPSTVTDPSDGTDGLATLREQVGTLGQTVETLAATVEALVSGQHHDESTGDKLPLLLRGKRVRE